ncbi:BlaI/MecI/CopY family transcriptional regulator [Schlesneria paludicola]|uniref:BlaI/MecI/CopY family transcriptional regulator n=1 Tax=Schlesneria paludicola TaxID=360056 RepID=UPI00029A11BD|nr:BlaI/MecI/CopY family transcriptional regulator [Schlesneria paludicola]
MTKHRLADLQLAIMHILWDKGEATVSDVQKALAPGRPLAYTTVGTMLSKMEANGQVSHRVDRRINVYRAVLQQENVSRSMISDLAQRLCAGDVTKLVCHLLDECDVSREELSVLKKLIRQKEQELNHDE